MLKIVLDKYSKIVYNLIIIYIINIIIIYNIINTNINKYNNKLNINYNNTYMGYCKVPPYIINKKAYYKIYKYTNDSQIAKAIADTKEPYWLAAIAKVESNYNPQIIGDKGDSYGLYQIQPKHWGYVPSSVEGQTKKAEDILSGLAKRGGIYSGVVRWNGRGIAARHYAKKVQKIRKEIIYA